MAEGGDPDETGTFDPNEGADERTPLYPRREEIPMRTRTSTSTPKKGATYRRNVVY